MGFNVVPSRFCSEHVAGKFACCFAGTCAVFSDSRLPPCLFDPIAVLCLCKSVEGNVQVLKICRSILRSRQKSDKNDNCRRTIASRCFGKAPTTLSFPFYTLRELQLDPLCLLSFFLAFLIRWNFSLFTSAGRVYIITMY